MNTKLKEIFNQIQAEEKLKKDTKVFLAERTSGYTGQKKGKLRYAVPAVACLCLFLLFWGGRWLYFTPTAEISIDINPSIELGINRFDRVISAEGLNDDGQELLKNLSVRFQVYTDAMKQICNNDWVLSLLSNDELMTITVTGLDEIQSSKILSGVETCTSEQGNTHCCIAPPEEVASAHEMGLSYGKYRAFLEVQCLDPNITPETIRHMTMREIRDYIDRLLSDKENDGNGNENPSENKENGHYGCGNGHGEGQGNGKRKNQLE